MWNYFQINNFSSHNQSICRLISLLPSCQSSCWLSWYSCSSLVWVHRVGGESSIESCLINCSASLGLAPCALFVLSRSPLGANCSKQQTATTWVTLVQVLCAFVSSSILVLCESEADAFNESIRMRAGGIVWKVNMLLLNAYWSAHIHTQTHEHSATVFANAIEKVKAFHSTRICGASTLLAAPHCALCVSPSTISPAPEFVAGVNNL